MNTELSTEQETVFKDVLAQQGTGDILVLAGPGSGKTRTLISSLCGLVEAGSAGEKIFAITFTNNAAAEMQVRLMEKAETLSLPSLHRVHVSTFHSWVGQLAASKFLRGRILP